MSKALQLGLLSLAFGWSGLAASYLGYSSIGYWAIVVSVVYAYFAVLRA